MESYNVIKTKKERNRVIIHQVDSHRVYEYSTIKGGLSWPVGVLPAYYCIWGEEYLNIDHKDENKRRGKLKLFSEYELPGISIEKLFTKLTDDTFLYCCDTIYTTMDESYSDFIQLFRDYVSKKNIIKGDLAQAPFSDNFGLGMAIINDKINDGTLIIPEDTIIHKQLKSIAMEHLEESPETKFNAINGLRFAVAAFKKFPEDHYVFDSGLKHYETYPGSWMR